MRVIAAGFACALVLIAGCSSSKDTSANRTTSPGAAASSRAESAVRPDIVIKLNAGDAPQNPVVVGGVLWVAAHRHDETLRVDIPSRKVTARVNTGTWPGAVAVGDNRVWIVHYKFGGLVALDTTTAQFVTRVSFDGEGCCRPALIGSTVWGTALVDGEPTLIGADAKTGKVLHTLAGVGDPFVVDGGLWAVKSGRLVKVDVVSAKVTPLPATDTVQGAPGGQAQGLSWTLNEAGVAIGLDTAGKVSRTVLAPAGVTFTGEGASVTTSGDTVWITDGVAALWRIRAGDTQVQKYAQLTPDELSLSGDGKGGVWVSLFASDTVEHFTG